MVPKNHYNFILVNGFNLKRLLLLLLFFLKNLFSKFLYLHSSSSLKILVEFYIKTKKFNILFFYIS